MSDGKTHARDSTVLAPIVGAAIAYSAGPLHGLFAGFGCLCGVVLSPDLDIEKRTHSETVMFRHGCVGWPFFLYWLPYAKFVPHRSPISHAPITSTLIRQLYLLPVYVIVAGLFGISWDILELYAWWVVGICVSDVAHWIRDGRPG